MYAARRNRIRLRITLLLMIAAMIVGAMISLQVAHVELVRINAVTLNSQPSTGSTDWLETLSALGEEVIQLFISMTSETR